MNKNILTDNIDHTLNEAIATYSEKANRIKMATAFFSDTAFIEQWLEASIKVDLLVSLRPPTNYYSLKKIHPKQGIHIQFKGKEFHSKFYLFYKENVPFACIIGSSNFTAGGLREDIETNVIITDNKYLTELDSHYSKLWKESHQLQPSDLESYKLVFDSFQKRNAETKRDQSRFEKKLITGRTKMQNKKRINKKAKQYFAFWKVVDELKEMLKAISVEEYPNVPVYLAMDHFWHWVKVEWTKENKPKPTTHNRRRVIPRMFEAYCAWDKSSGSYTKEMAKTSRTLFAKKLSERNIGRLTQEESQHIYANLHSGAMRTKRFGADEAFAENNSIQKIRASLKYLLYSNDELDVRIHNLCTDSSYKLEELSFSGVQELIGWVSPRSYPIRNAKADEALKLLGYDIDLYTTD